MANFKIEGDETTHLQKPPGLRLGSMKLSTAPSLDRGDVCGVSPLGAHRHSIGELKELMKSGRVRWIRLHLREVFQAARLAETAFNTVMNDASRGSSGRSRLRLLL